MRKIDYILPRWGWFVLYAVLFGGILFSLGQWCQVSMDFPSPALVLLPLPQRLLAGLSFIFWVPPSLIAFSLLLATSRMLITDLGRLLSASVVLAAGAAVVVGALWVPNAIVRWPISILGDHTISELVETLFAFHIVPAPQGTLESAPVDAIFSWQLWETTCRFCILLIVWIISLSAIWRIGRRQKTANPATRIE